MCLCLETRFILVVYVSLLYVSILCVNCRRVCLVYGEENHGIVKVHCAVLLYRHLNQHYTALLKASNSSVQTSFQTCLQSNLINYCLQYDMDDTPFYTGFESCRTFALLERCHVHFLNARVVERCAGQATYL